MSSRTLRLLQIAASTTLIAGGLLLSVGTSSATADGLGHGDSGPRTTHGPCAYTSTPDDPAVRPVGLPPDPRHTPDRGTATVRLRTNMGTIDLSLDRAKAPCTVQSFLHLTNHGFYNRTICHRLTAYPTLSVLQCGDPSGTGEGGPGYRYADELDSAVALPNWPGDDTGTRKLYGRGLLAMANAGPDTNGSQFFVVYADSRLRPNYTVFGSVAPSGLSTLDRIAAAGIAPTPEDPAPVDGAPAQEVEILTARRHG